RGEERPLVQRATLSLGEKGRENWGAVASLTPSHAHPRSLLHLGNGGAAVRQGRVDLGEGHLLAAAQQGIRPGQMVLEAGGREERPQGLLEASRAPELPARRGLGRAARSWQRQPEPAPG